MAGRQLYFEDELTNEWKAARDAAVEWGKLRNHRKTTKRNDRKLPLWVALDFQDHGVNSLVRLPETLGWSYRTVSKWKN